MLTSTISAASPISTIKSDQEIIFFPTLVRPIEPKGWELQIHGCVYEPDKRRVVMALLRKALGFKHIHLTDGENTIFTERARLFMVDHKGGRRIVVRIGTQDFDLCKSRSNGHFSGTIRLLDSDIQQRPLPPGFHAVLPAGDSRVFAGQLALFNESGLIVISDIDDTIKVTQVRDRRATLRNTFLQPFQPVPGMAALYRDWARQHGAQFCYVSASPWQLYSPLLDFVRSNDFPAGVFQLKQFRWKDKSFLSLFESPQKYKPGVIEPLLKRFPDCRFALVGDSGESDPEIYGDLARKYPNEVSRIFIRDMASGPTPTARFNAAFRDLPQCSWKVFREPSEISWELSKLD